MATFVNDTFSGAADNDNLTDHTGEVGATWTAQTGNPTFAKMTAAGRVFPNGFEFTLASGLPATTDYSVFGDFTLLSAHGGETIGLLARWIPGNPVNGYTARFVASTSDVSIFKTVNGTNTQLGTATITLPAIGGADKTMQFRVTGSLLELIYDGVTVVSVTDTTFPDKGSVGIRTNGITGPSASLQIGRFWAIDAPTSTRRKRAGNFHNNEDSRKRGKQDDEDIIDLLNEMDSDG